MQEKSYKKNMVKAFSFDSSKVIFILLTKVITFYMGFITIYIR